MKMAMIDALCTRTSSTTCCCKCLRVLCDTMCKESLGIPEPVFHGQMCDSCVRECTSKTSDGSLVWRELAIATTTADRAGRKMRGPGLKASKLYLGTGMEMQVTDNTIGSEQHTAATRQATPEKNHAGEPQLAQRQEGSEETVTGQKLPLRLSLTVKENDLSWHAGGTGGVEELPPTAPATLVDDRPTGFTFDSDCSRNRRTGDGDSNASLRGVETARDAAMTTAPAIAATLQDYSKMKTAMIDALCTRTARTTCCCKCLRVHCDTLCKESLGIPEPVFHGQMCDSCVRECTTKTRDGALVWRRLAIATNNADRGGRKEHGCGLEVVKLYLGTGMEMQVTDYTISSEQHTAAARQATPEQSHAENPPLAQKQEGSEETVIDQRLPLRLSLTVEENETGRDAVMTTGASCTDGERPAREKRGPTMALLRYSFTSYLSSSSSSSNGSGRMTGWARGRGERGDIDERNRFSSLQGLCPWTSSRQKLGRFGGSVDDAASSPLSSVVSHASLGVPPDLGVTEDDDSGDGARQLRPERQAGSVCKQLKVVSATNEAPAPSPSAVRVAGTEVSSPEKGPQDEGETTGYADRGGRGDRVEVTATEQRASLKPHGEISQEDAQSGCSSFNAAYKRGLLHGGLMMVGVGLVGAAVWGISSRPPCR